MCVCVCVCVCVHVCVHTMSVQSVCVAELAGKGGGASVCVYMHDCLCVGV